MTSTNDGKEVKNNLISGPKGKTYYIELYKSLESSLNESLPLPQRTVALCNAWRQVHSLCSHSAPSTHTHLLTWIQRHTATTVLQTEWRTESSLNERKLLEDAIDSFITEAEAAIAGRGDHLPWEKQLVPRAEWFKKLSSDPWGHAVLLRILDQRGEQPSDEEVLDWLKEERGIVFVSRLRQLVASKCDDIALTLASAVMDRVRRTETPSPDYDDEDKPLPDSSKPQTFGDIMSSAAGFSPDVSELLIDIEFVLLDKLEKRKTFIDLAKQTPLKLCYQLAERLRTRLDTSPKEKRLWKNAKHVATTIAQVSIARCMVRPRCAGAARACLYWMARVLARVVGLGALPQAAAVLAAPASTARHLHTFTAALHAECADEMKPFICELYIRAITAGMNELERLKLKTEKDNETEARVQEALLASWFVSLGGVLSASARIRAECDLTAFSLHPAPNNYERLRSQAPPPPLLQEKLEPKIESESTDFGSWANDSRANTNFVKTSETLNLKNTLQQINVVSTAILLEGEGLGLSVELCQDLAVLLSGPRVKTFTWEMNREELLANCRAYMERTGGGTKALTTELKYLNLDPSQFQHLPEESDGEDDIYYGIEKGYESHLPEPERELEPEQIWADALSPERNSSIESDAEEYGSKKKSNKPVVETSEEQDPLSLHTEVKPKDVPKKERQPSKERSKKPKAKKTIEPKEPSTELTTQEQEEKIKKDLIKKEKKEKRKQDKLEKALALSAHSISELVGMKVVQYDKTVLEANKLKPYKERKKKTDGHENNEGLGNKEKKERKDKKHKDGVIPATVSTADAHGITLTSPEAGVVFDGLFSMDDLKTISPEKATSECTVNRSLSQPLPVFKPPVTVTETQTSASTTVPEKKETKEEIKIRIAKLLSFRKQRKEKISQHCANRKRLSQNLSYGAVSTATSTTTSLVMSVATSGTTSFTNDLPPPLKPLPVMKSTETQMPSPKVYSKHVSNQDTISSPNISQYYRSPVNKPVNIIPSQTSQSPLRVQHNNNDNSQMNFPFESTKGLKPADNTHLNDFYTDFSKRLSQTECSPSAKSTPVNKMTLLNNEITKPVNNMGIPVINMAPPVNDMVAPVNNMVQSVNKMTNEHSPISRSLSGSRIPNIRNTSKQKMREQKEKKPRKSGTSMIQQQLTNSSLNQQKVIRMNDFLSEIQQSLNAGIPANSNFSDLAVMQRDKLKHDAVLNTLLNTTANTVPTANIHSTGPANTKACPVGKRPSTGHSNRNINPVPAANRSTGIKMSSAPTPNRTGLAAQTTKTSTKQIESAPNTFSRLSYMHKNKLDTKHAQNEGKLISQKEAISNELERHIAEFKLAQLQYQHQGSLVVQRGIQRPADHNPVLANMLTSTASKTSFVSQNKNTVSCKKPTNPNTSDGVLMNSAIDRELMNLFHQKSVLNQTHIKPCTKQIVITNDLQGRSFDNIKVSNATNLPKATQLAASENKLQNNNHVLTSLEALNATATVAKAPKSTKREPKPKSTKPRKARLEIIKPQIQKEMVQNVYQSKDSVTATFITKDKLKDPSKTEPEPVKQQNWVSVMDELLAQKTPSRGPNALNLALKINKETKIPTKMESTQKSSVIANVPMKQTCNLHISHDKSLNIKKETLSSPKENSEIKILKIQNFPVDQFRKYATKKEKSQHDVKKSEKPVIKPGSKLLLKQASKPPVNKQIDDEYALLEELIDQDLQEEIDDLTSDEDSNIPPSGKLPKNPSKTYDKQTIRTVSNQNISKASQAMCLNSRPTCSNNEANKTIQSTNRVNENAQQLYRQPSNVVTTHSSYIPIRNSVENVLHQTYTITNQTNSNVVINVPVNLSNMLYVNPRVPCESYAIVQDTYILNSNPNVLVYPNTYSTPVPNSTVYQNEVLNKLPSEESVEKMSAAESLISMGMPRQEHVNDTPKVQAVFNKLDNVPESHMSTAEDALAPEKFVTSTRSLENASPTKIKSPPKNVQNLYQHAKLDLQEAKQPIAIENPKEDIVSQAKDNLRTAPLEKSESVFEILNKLYQEDTVKRDSFDAERLATKRNNILNRVIHHKGLLEAIPLTYASLHSKSNKENADTNIDKTVSVEKGKTSEPISSSKAEKTLIVSEKADETAKENNETKPCRRILLRSSNNLKTPQSKPELMKTVKTAELSEEPKPETKRKRQRRSKDILADKTLKKSPKNKKTTKQNKKMSKLDDQKPCEDIKPDCSIVNVLNIEQALTTAVIPKTVEEKSDKLSVTDICKKVLLASLEPDDLYKELKTCDGATDIVKKEVDNRNENLVPALTDLKQNSKPEVLDPHDRLMQQNFTTMGVNLQVIRDIFDMDDDSSPIASPLRTINEINNIVKDEIEEPKQTISTIVNKVLDTTNELSTTQSKTSTGSILGNDEIKNVKISTPLWKVEEDEYLKSVIVTHLYTRRRGERLEKCVRVKLPNNTSFKVTVSGNTDLDINSLLTNPDVKSIIHSNWNEVKQFKLRVEHNYDKNKLLNAQEIKHCSETIDLLSDEEPERTKENHTMSFKTESGTFKIGSLDATTHKIHQDKFSCKAFVNLIRHPNSFFEKREKLGQECQQNSGIKTLTPSVSTSSPSEKVQDNDHKTENVRLESLLEKDEKVSDQISEITDSREKNTVPDTDQECTDNLYGLIEKHDYKNEKKEVSTKDTIDHLAQCTDLESNNYKLEEVEKCFENQEVKSNIDTNIDNTAINKLEVVVNKSYKDENQGFIPNVDVSCVSTNTEKIIEDTSRIPESKNQEERNIDVTATNKEAFHSYVNKNQEGRNNVAEINEVSDKSDMKQLQEVAHKCTKNKNQEVNYNLGESLVAKTDVIQTQTNTEKPTEHKNQVDERYNNSEIKNQVINTDAELKSVSRIEENQEINMNKLEELPDKGHKLENEKVMSNVDVNSVSQIDKPKDTQNPTCLIEVTNSNVNMPDISKTIPEIIASIPDKNFNIVSSEEVKPDFERLTETSRPKDETDSVVEEIITRTEKRTDSDSDWIVIKNKTSHGVHKKLDLFDGDIISILDGDEDCDKLDANMIEVNKIKIEDKIETSQKFKSKNTEPQTIPLSNINNNLAITKTDAKKEILAPVISQNSEINNKAESNKAIENLRGLPLDSIVVTSGEYEIATLSPSPSILDNLSDVPNRPSLTEIEKSKIDPAPTPMVITDVIELDDSSNDSLDNLIPDLSKILENKLQELKTEVIAPPKLVIDDLKSLLLDDLGVMAKETLISSEPIVLTSDEDEPVNIQKPKKSSKASKKKPTPRKKVTNVGALIKEARTRKCFIKLTRCDTKMPETILLDDDDDTDEAVVQVTTDEINVNIDESDDELTYVEPEPTRRSESPSILNTFWPITETSLLSPERLQSEIELYDGKTSPVIEIYDELAVLISKKLPTEILNVPVNCSAEWFETKKQIISNAQCKPEESCLMYNVSTLSRLVLKLIIQMETLMSMKPSARICRIRRLNPVKRKIDVSYFTNKKSKMDKDVQLKDNEDNVSSETAIKLSEREEPVRNKECSAINLEMTEVIQDKELALDPTPILDSLVNDTDVIEATRSKLILERAINEVIPPYINNHVLEQSIETAVNLSDKEESLVINVKITEIIEDKNITIDPIPMVKTRVKDMEVVEPIPIKLLSEQAIDELKTQHIENDVPEQSIETSVMDFVEATPNKQAIDEVQPQDIKNYVPNTFMETAAKLSEEGETPCNQECLSIVDENTEIIEDRALKTTYIVGIPGNDMDVVESTPNEVFSEKAIGEVQVEKHILVQSLEKSVEILAEETQCDQVCIESNAEITCKIEDCNMDLLETTHILPVMQNNCQTEWFKTKSILSLEAKNTFKNICDDPLTKNCNESDNSLPELTVLEHHYYNDDLTISPNSHNEDDDIKISENLENDCLSAGINLLNSTNSRTNTPDVVIDGTFNDDSTMNTMSSASFDSPQLCDELPIEMKTVETVESSYAELNAVETFIDDAQIVENSIGTVDLAIDDNKIVDSPNQETCENLENDCLSAGINLLSSTNSRTITPDVVIDGTFNDDSMMNTMYSASFNSPTLCDELPIEMESVETVESSSAELNVVETCIDDAQIFENSTGTMEMAKDYDEKVDSPNQETCDKVIESLIATESNELQNDHSNVTISKESSTDSTTCDIYKKDKNVASDDVAVSIEIEVSTDYDPEDDTEFISLLNSTNSRTNTPDVVTDGTFNVDNAMNTMCSASFDSPTLCDELPIEMEAVETVESSSAELNAVETSIDDAQIVENSNGTVDLAIDDEKKVDSPNQETCDKIIESLIATESNELQNDHSNVIISKESSTDSTTYEIYKNDKNVASDDVADSIEIEVSTDYDPEDDNTELISPCERLSNVSNDIESELKCSTPLSEDGIVIKGIEIEDPLIGKCYIFRPIGDSASDTDSLRNNDSPVIDSEGFNISTESGYEIVDEYGEDSKNSTVDSMNSPITLIQDENEKSPELILDNPTEDLHDIDYSVIPPKKTYLRNTFKRKVGMSDIKIPVKKYRKGKNIDATKQASSSIADMNYRKEYKQLMDYVDNLSFSYSIPFHKDYIDTETTLQNWPTKDTVSSPLISEDTCTSENMLFVDNQDLTTNRCDPIDLTLDEEMSQNIDYEIENSVEIQETNFKTGFGEGSGRVIQNFTRGGDHSKFSAAALSDVKQNQPILMSEDCKNKCLHRYKSSEEVNVSKINKHLNYLNLRNKVKMFFEKTRKELFHEDCYKKLKDDEYSYNLLKNVPGLFETDFLVPAVKAQLVQVVQVGQPPVSAAAQNPVTCDPRVTQVSDASPSQCGDNSPGSENNESNIKAEYTELTNADLSMVNMHKQMAPITETPQEDSNINTEQSSTSPHFPRNDSPNNGSQQNIDNTDPNNSNNQINMVYQFENNVNESEVVSQDNISTSSFMSTTTTTISEIASEMKSISSNGTSDKTDQIAHAMSAAGITTEANEDLRPVVNLISQNVGRPGNTLNITNNNYQKTQLNAISLQQALAQILPHSLNQSNNGNQQNAHNNVGPQVLHIVQGKNANGNHITLLDNNPQTVLNASNATQVLHIVQNKSANSGTLSNGTPTIQPTSFGGLSLVDSGLQQGGNQLLHIVNTGAQKSQNANQLLKRVNLLTNLANVQGTNDQKMVQFVCKSADGKIHLNAPQQQRMVLRLQPIDNTAVQAQNKASQDESSALNKDNNQQEIKTRSIYEENYTKYVQENPNSSPGNEKATSLPKFNQAFGKPLYQEGTSKDNEMNNTSMMEMTSPETDGKSSENNINLDQLSSPPLLLRQTSVPSSTAQTQQNIVQQLKQTMGPMNIQTMHGGVIYTRQIPVNLGGGQTINLITVPTTELLDESGQKQQSEKEPSIIKIVSQSQPQTSSANESNEDRTTTPTTSSENTGQAPQQTQPVLTHMRIKLPMLSKAPQIVGGARVVRPSFFQIQRNIVGGANQQVFQQYVLTTAPPLGQQTIRLPQAQVTRQVKVPTDSQSSSEAHLSSSTLEQLREFDMVLEQVKERSTVQPGTPTSFTKQADVTDSPTISIGEQLNQSIIYSIGNNQTVNVAYVTRKPSVLTPTTCTFVRSPDSTAIDSPSTTHIIHSANDNSDLNHIKSKIAAKAMKARPSKPTITSSANTIKLNPLTPKPSLQKPQEDEQTTQRILYILNEYKEQVENSPDKDKPAPRRRSNPPTNPSGSSKRKKGSGGSRRPGCTRDHSPVTGDDAGRTMGSEDSSCGTSQGDCNESCSMEAGSPQDSTRKVVRKLTFDQETTLVTQSRPAPPRNVIVADGQTITVARSTTPGKPTTAVLMPSNYILPLSMVKGGRQIAIVTNQGPKLLTVGGSGEGAAANALLLQRLIGGQGGLKPVLARPGVRHVRLPTTALQAFNLTPSVSSPGTTSISSPSSVPTPELVQSQTSSPWAERDASKNDNEQWNLQSGTDTHEYGYDTENVTSRADNDNRTVLDSIPEQYSPDMEAQRIFDKMFDVDSKKSFADSNVESPRFDIQSDCYDRAYTQVVQRKDGSGQGLHRVTHISAAALRHKYAMLEHELKLQKSLSEECEDLGVDSPSASELFPEADLLFASSPAAHDDHATASHTVPGHLVNQQAAPTRDLEDQLAAEHLLAVRDSGQHDLTEVRLSVGGKDTRPGRIDHEEFARSHPNTTFHTEPTDDVTPVQPYTLPTGLKTRHLTSTIFHAGSVPTTVLMSGPQSVIAQTHQDSNLPAVKYIENDADIDNIINAPASNEGSLSTLVKDDGLTRYDIMSDRELHLSNTASAIVHASGAQVIKRVCYDDDKRSFLMDETDIIAGNDAKMAVADEESRDAGLRAIVADDDRSSPERPELFWESNSASERSVKQLDFSSDSEKCCKSPSLDETNSTDSSGIGSHMRLDSVIKEARSRDRSGSIEGSSADDTIHPPLRTYPAKRSFHSEEERSLSGKTRAGEGHDSSEVRRRSSIRGVVKRGCHCCNGSPTPSSRKKARQKKPSMDFHSN